MNKISRHNLVNLKGSLIWYGYTVKHGGSDSIRIAFSDSAECRAFSFIESV